MWYYQQKEKCHMALLREDRMIGIEEVISSFPEHIKAGLRSVSFDKGDTIIRKGDEVKSAYIFTSGTYDVIEDDYMDKRFMISKESEGPFVSLMDIYSGHEAQCVTLIASERCIGYSLPRRLCLDLLDSPCLFQPFLIRHWASMFYATTVNMSRYPIYKTRQKLLSLLEESSGRLTITRNDLAALLGCSRRTLFRVLKALKEEGIITTSGSVIKAG